MLFLQRITLSTFLILFSSSCLACTCIGASPLIQIVESGSADYLLRVRVDSYDRAVNGYPQSMQVSVLEELSGDLDEELTTVYGDTGMSCSPFVTEYAVGKEWVLPVMKAENNSNYYIAACAPKVSVEGNDIVGLASTRSDLVSLRMSLAEFKKELELYSNAVAWAIERCSSVWDRCEHIRASYDLDSGELLLPSVGIKQTIFGGAEKVYTGQQSWKLVLVEGTTDTYRKIESK